MSVHHFINQIKVWFIWKYLRCKKNGFKIFTKIKRKHRITRH